MMQQLTKKTKITNYLENLVSLVVYSCGYWIRCFDASKYLWKAWKPCCHVCVLSSSFWLVNSVHVLIQAHLILYPFEKKCFLKSCEISTCWIVKTTCCLTLSGFQNDLEKLCFVLSFLSHWNNRLLFLKSCEILTCWIVETTCCFYKILNRKLISICCFGKQSIVFITEFS